MFYETLQGGFPKAPLVPESSRVPKTYVENHAIQSCGRGARYRWLFNALKDLYLYDELVILLLVFFRLDKLLDNYIVQKP